jgi:hypothetical protein
MDEVQKLRAKELAWKFWKAGWDGCVARGGGWLKTYCGEPAWGLIAREEFEALMLEWDKLWEERNVAEGIRAFNQVYAARESQVIPTPLEATNPGKFL